MTWRTKRRTPLTPGRLRRHGQQIDGSEAKWAGGTVLAGLNDELKDIATTHGWTFVDSHVSPSRTHGYCAEDSWVRSWSDAKVLQENWGKPKEPSSGVVHPTAEGQQAYRDAILPVLSDLGMPTE